MSDSRYSGFFRDDGSRSPKTPSRHGDSVPEAERTMIRPRKVIVDRDEAWPGSKADGPTSESTSARTHTAESRKPTSRTRRRTMGRSLGLTLASTVVPGLGLLGARPRWAKIIGVLVPLLFIGSLGFVAWRGISTGGKALAALAVDPALLAGATVLLIGGAIFWAWLITLTHLLTRPRGMRVMRRGVGALLVTALTFTIAAPLAVGARYAVAHQELLSSLFDNDVEDPGRPDINTGADNPWKDIPRLNILLLGADSSGTRIEEGGGQYVPRTDTIMVASIDTATGDLTLIQIPRNVQYTPFPEGSKLAELFPRGFRGEGGEQEWFVNAIWEKTVSGDYPQMAEAVSPATYPGAVALKQGVEGITGLKMDYFVLVNIDGLQGLIDAMGGVTLNINRRLPIGGDTDAGIKPHGWLEPGPNQKLDGYHAMWYARGRYGLDDFDRMPRQSCLVNAIVRQANPATMLTSYEAIAQASSEMVITDIPSKVLEPLVQLSLKVKDGSVSRVVFVDGRNGYSYGNPDFKEMHRVVQQAIGHTPEPTGPAATSDPTSEPAPTSSAPETPEPTSEAPSAPGTLTSAEPTQSAPAEEVGDACAYRPQEDP